MQTNVFQPTINFELLDTRAQAPSKASEGANAYDVYACLPEDVESVTVETGQVHLIPTGVKVELPDLHIPVGNVAVLRLLTSMLMIPRSGDGHKRGIQLGNTAGLIDCDYRGQVFVSIKNTGTEPFVIHTGDRIAQALFLPTLEPVFNQTESLSDTARGEGGFGHTGRK